MIYVTGDTHGDFSRIAHFCARMNTIDEGSDMRGDQRS